MIQNCFIPGVVFILPLLFSHHGIQTTATDDVEIHGDFSSLEKRIQCREIGWTESHVWFPTQDPSTLCLFNDVQVVHIKTYRLASWKTTPQQTCPLETSPMDPTEDMPQWRTCGMEPGLVTATGQPLGLKEFTQEVPTGKAQKTTCTMRWKVLHDPAPCLFICKISKMKPNEPKKKTPCLHRRHLKCQLRYEASLRHTQCCLVPGPGAKMLPVPEKTGVFDASNTPRKTNMSPENQWLEDVFPIEIVPF